MQPSARDQKTIARILKVNHAGEYSAIRIYKAQLFVARLMYPDLSKFLSETLRHEIEHCEKFRILMPSRTARSCRIMSLWGLGGYALGTMTSIFGRNGIMICTAAVESTVHEHLEDQKTFLRSRDEELRTLISEIQVQEDQHLHYAEHRLRAGGIFWTVLDRVVRLSTEAVIWLSTWGDVSRMKAEIRS